MTPVEIGRIVQMVWLLLMERLRGPPTQETRILHAQNILRIREADAAARKARSKNKKNGPRKGA
jgi:hypothetical protein